MPRDKVIRQDGTLNFDYVSDALDTHNLQLLTMAINVKSFGAKGDGITDDTVAIQNAINNSMTTATKMFFPKGTYLIKSNLVLNDGEYYGEKGTTIILGNWTGEACITNKNSSIGDLYKFNKIIIRNLNFKLGSTRGGYGIRFINCQDSSIKDCTFTSDVSNTFNFSPIDLYSNNSNIVIESCNFTVKGNVSTILTTPILVREYNASSTTEYITIRNCICEKMGADESLWIDAWKGTIQNVLVDNISITDNGISQNVIWLGANGENSKLYNVKMKNSTIVKQIIFYRVITIADSQDQINFSECNNIEFSGNTVNVNDISQAGIETRIIHCGIHQRDDNSIAIKNNRIENTSNSKIVNVILGTCSTKDNIINCYSTYVYNGVSRIINDTVTNGTGKICRNCKEINGLKATCNSLFMSNLSYNSNSITIKNSILQCVGAFMENITAVTAPVISIVNTDINNGTDYILNSWSQTVGKTMLTIANSNITTASIINDSSMASYVINNVTINNTPYSLSAIPTSGDFTLGRQIINSAPTAGGYLGWVCVSGGTACGLAWAASTAYTTVNVRYANSNVYKCKVAGTSGTVAPSHTSGDAVDGTVTWTYMGPLAIFKTFGPISS